MIYVLTRILPEGQEKTSTVEHQEKKRAAMQAARAHRDNLVFGHTEMDAVYDALIEAIPGTKVGPFSGYCYRIDSWL